MYAAYKKDAFIHINYLPGNIDAEFEPFLIHRLEHVGDEGEPHGEG
jgi:hypothetical protein